MLEYITPASLIKIGIFLILFSTIMKLILKVLEKYAIKEMIENPDSFGQNDLPEQYIRSFRIKTNISTLDYRHTKYFNDELSKKRLSKNGSLQQ